MQKVDYNRFVVQWEIISDKENKEKQEQNTIGQMFSKRVHDIISLVIRKRGINDEKRLNNIENTSNTDILPSK